LFYKFWGNEDEFFGSFEPEGRPGEPGDLKIAKGVLLAPLPLPGLLGLLFGPGVLGNPSL